MAINPGTQFVGKIDTTDANYPYGKAQNITVPNDGTGTPFEAVLLNDIFGMQQALLDDAGAIPSGSPDNTTASQYLDAIKKAAQKSEYIPLEGPNIAIKGYLDRQGVWANTEAEIQDAADYIEATGERQVIKLPPGTVIPFSSGVILNVAYVSIDGNGAEIDASGMASGVAIYMASDVAPPIPQNMNGVKNLVLSGPGSGSSVIGFKFHNTWGTGAGPHNTFLERVYTRAFSVGELYTGNSSPAFAIGCSIYDCATGVQVPIPQDIGKIISRFGGEITGCVNALKMQCEDGVFRLFGVSLLDNDKIADVTNGIVDLHGCEIVAADYAATPITLAGTSAGVNMIGGSLRLTGGAAGTFNHWVDAAAGSFFRSKGTTFAEVQTATGEFATGAGLVTVRDAVHSDNYGGFSVLHEDVSKLADGGFEDSEIVDDIFLTGGTDSVIFPIVERFIETGGAVELALNSGYFRSGVQSLGFEKGTLAGSGARFALATVPVTAGQRVGFRGWWRKPASLDGGTIRFRYLFAKVYVDGYGVPKIKHRATAGDFHTVNHVVTVADTGWTEETYNPTGCVAPDWATHLIVELDADDWNGRGDKVFFDDLNINILG